MKTFIIAILVALSIFAVHEETPAERTEVALMVRQVDTEVLFEADGHLFTAEVDELLDLGNYYHLTFDTKGTADRTDDEIIGISHTIRKGW